MNKLRIITLMQRHSQAVFSDNFINSPRFYELNAFSGRCMRIALNASLKASGRIYAWFNFVTPA